MESCKDYQCHKKCFVPNCKSSSKRTPDKRFVTVPRENKKRQLWLKAVQLDINKYSSNSTLYCCLDHFTFNEDVENWLEHELLNRNKKKIRLKPGVTPHIFKWEENIKRNENIQKSVVANNKEMQEFSEKRTNEIDNGSPSCSHDCQKEDMQNDKRLPSDMENYMQYKIMGSVKKVLIKPGCFPSKFECQPPPSSPPKRTMPCSCKLGDVKKHKMDLCESSINGTICQSNGKSSSTYACDIDEFDPLRIDIKTEHIEIKEEPIGYENTGNYEDSKVKIETTCEPANCEESDIDSEFSSECIELGIYVTKELKKLKDYNSLAVAKQCIKSVILAAQNGLYKNGITPSVLPLPTDSVVKDEPIDQ